MSRVCRPTTLTCLAALVLIQSAGCVSASRDAGTVATTPNGGISPHADVRDRWIAAANALPQVQSFTNRFPAFTDRWKLHHLYPQICSLMDEYVDATVYAPARHGVFDAIVVDDDGKPVPEVAVRCVALGYTLLPWLPDPRTGEDFKATGEFKVPLPLTVSSIHLRLSKPGYRDVSIDIVPRSDDDDARYNDAEDMLE